VSQGAEGPASRLGVSAGQVVLEFGVDSDVDQSLREAIAQITGEALVDDTYGDVVDVVLVWWRDGDGDLTDTLVDALTLLVDGGVVWIITPKAGRDGHVEPYDIADAAVSAGLSQTSSISAAPEWSGTRLMTSKGSRH